MKKTKKYFVFMLCMLFAASLGSCGGNKSANKQLISNGNEVNSH